MTREENIKQREFISAMEDKYDYRLFKLFCAAESMEPMSFASFASIAEPSEPPISLPNIQKQVISIPNMDNIAVKPCCGGGEVR